jgi:hypothetical protein
MNVKVGVFAIAAGLVGALVFSQSIEAASAPIALSYNNGQWHQTRSSQQSSDSTAATST